MENLLKGTLLTLGDAGVSFVVCGGVACILHGVPRATWDLDLRVGLEADNLEKLIAVARSLGLVPRVPEPLEALLDPERRRCWIEEKQAVVYTLLSPAGDFAIDLFLQYPISFEDLLASADVLEIDGRPIRVSCKRHLIEAKRAVHPPRKQDLRDIADLLELLDA